MSTISKHGDPTTTGGVVIATLSTMFNDGSRLAVAGDQATCGTCPGAWPIAATGTHMVCMGRAAVLDQDSIICPCKKNRVIAEARNMHYRHPHGGARAATAAATSAVAIPAAMVLREAVPPPATTTTPAMPQHRTQSAAERRCILRIGIFFDGTRNNAGNTETFSQCQASTASALGQDQQEQDAILGHCKPYVSDPSSSYANGYTNVWRLYQLYRDSTPEPFGEDDKEYFIRIYVEGIGTRHRPAGQPPGHGLGHWRYGHTRQSGTGHRKADSYTNFPIRP
ncbi:PAAR domain-containing protein [Dyella sp. M7H15-1]|uniref:PAAR domain-containing protein n=1 Tax=Dyella sp. M7H15-1 TaxID=2501295 RepID=UPI0010050B9F|nr:PAAR domain-containing protein [Dyella sp. M7H15-1]QAU25110.1 PAAR domain-containing protein [Dyella sp. M7H15-1]